VSDEPTVPDRDAMPAVFLDERLVEPSVAK